MPAAPPAQMHDDLPRPLTRFVGRADELQSLRAVLQSDRLVTLTGVGGCGKTRLAREAAAAALERFPDGVRWIDLAPLADEALVAHALASAWGVVEQPGHPLMDTLIEALKPRQALLVLDNCEHLAAMCAWCGQALLEACPAVTILATSRESLGVPGEMVVPVAPLPVPDERSCDDPAQLVRSDAVNLFMDRARTAAPSFVLSGENVRDVGRICRKLDGIPLALELAAARVRHLGVRQIADRLQHAIQILGGGSRTVPLRQQTLEATLDWSYALLSPAESALLRKLAVFAGDFTLEAVEGVCAEPQSGWGDILDVLGRLVDKSLVLAREHGGAVRYRLLEMIRQYAHAKLEAEGEEAAARSRHAVYYGRLAQRAGIDLNNNVAHRWLDILERDHENLRTAIGWSLEHDGPEHAGVTAASLWRFWLIRGHLAEGRRWLELALGKLPGRTLERAQVLQSLAILTMHHQGYAAAAPLVAEELALFQELNDRQGLAIALINAGLLAHFRGDYTRAMIYYEQSLPLCAQVAGEHAIVLCLNSMGVTALHLGDVPRGRALFSEAVARARAADAVPDVASTLTNLGIALLMSQEYDPAIARFEESLRIRREISDPGGTAHTLRFLGRAALEQGDPARAEAYYFESFALREALGEDEGLAEALEGLAAVAAARGDGATAARRLGAAETLRERTGMPLPAIDQSFYDQWLARIRGLLGEPALTTAWTQGRLLAPRDARDGGQVAAPLTPNRATQPAPTAKLAAAPAEPAVPAPSAALAASPARARPVLSVFALGGARIYRRDALIDPAEWTYRRARELLFFLLCQDGATKEQIGLALWPDSDTDQLRAQLHPVLHHLRQALGAPDWVLFERGRYRFNRTLDYAFDVEAFERHLAHAARSQPHDPTHAIRHLEQALKLYQGEFLAGESDSVWVARTREAVRSRRREALSTLGQLHATTGADARAAGAYRLLIADDPYQEQPYRDLMRCLVRQGERAQALRTYDQLAELLRSELGAMPAPESAALAERVRRGELV